MALSVPSCNMNLPSSGFSQEPLTRSTITNPSQTDYGALGPAIDDSRHGGFMDIHQDRPDREPSQPLYYGRTSELAQELNIDNYTSIQSEPSVTEPHAPGLHQEQVQKEPNLRGSPRCDSDRDPPTCDLRADPLPCALQEDDQCRPMTTDDQCRPTTTDDQCRPTATGDQCRPIGTGDQCQPRTDGSIRQVTGQSSALQTDSEPTSDVSTTAVAGSMCSGGHNQGAFKGDKLKELPQHTPYNGFSHMAPQKIDLGPEDLQIAGPGININISNANTVQVGNNNVLTVYQQPHAANIVHYGGNLAKPKDARKKVNLEVAKRIATEADLDLVCDHLGRDWRNLGTKLGLSVAELDRLEYDYQRNGLREIVFQMLVLWRSRSGPTATLKNLAQALLKIKRADIVRKFATEKT